MKKGDGFIFWIYSLQYLPPVFLLGKVREGKKRKTWKINLSPFLSGSHGVHQGRERVHVHGPLVQGPGVLPVGVERVLEDRPALV